MVTSGTGIVIRQIKQATDEQIERMVSVTVDAFVDVRAKHLEYIVGGDMSLAPVLSRAQIKAAVIGGKIFVAGFGPDDISSVAIYFGPGEEFGSSEEQRNAGFSDFMERLSPRAQTWWLDFFMPTFETTAKEAFGDGYHKASWNLMSLATDPPAQRKGLASSILRTVESKATENGDPLTLEVDEAGPLGFYEQLGFKRKTHMVLKSSFDDTSRLMYFLNKEPSS